MSMKASANSQEAAFLRKGQKSGQNSVRSELKALPFLHLTPNKEEFSMTGTVTPNSIKLSTSKNWKNFLKQVKT